MKISCGLCIRIAGFMRQNSTRFHPASRCALPAFAMSLSRGLSSTAMLKCFPAVDPVRRRRRRDASAIRHGGACTAAYEGTIRAGTGVQRSAMLDMWGPGAAASRFSAFRPSGLDHASFGQVWANWRPMARFKRPSFEVAQALAKITEGLTPDTCRAIHS